jgi:DNA-binding transcriptional LysR family regulator
VELRRLRHFLAIARAGSFSEAATRIGVTQPTLSASLAQLEAEFGVKLMVRGRFGAALTRYGRSLLKRAQLIESEARLAKLEIEALRGSARGTLTVGLGAFFEHRFAAPALMRFHAKRIGVIVKVVTGTSSELLELMLRGELDVIVSTPSDELPIPTEALAHKMFVLQDRVACGLRHPLLSLRRPGLADLAKYPWVLSSSIDHIRSALFARYGAVGLDPPKHLVLSDSVPMIIDLVANGSYLAIVNDMYPLETNRITLLPKSIFSLGRSAVVFTRRDSDPNPLAPAFVAELRAELKVAGIAVQLPPSLRGITERESGRRRAR